MAMMYECMINDDIDHADDDDDFFRIVPPHEELLLLLHPDPQGTYIDNLDYLMMMTKTDLMLMVDNGG